METLAVVNETYTLPRVVGNRPRMTTFKYPRYFTDTLKVFDKDNNLLIRNKHYMCRGFNGIYSRTLGRDVCSEISIIDVTLTGDITVSYVPLKTESLLVDDEFIERVKSVDWRNRPVHWDYVYNRPQYFPPSGHIHHFYDLYYWDDFCTGIERITDSIRLGKSTVYNDELKAYHDKVDEITGEIKSIDALFTAHDANNENPHLTSLATLIGPNGQHYDQIPLLPLALDGDLTLGQPTSLVTIDQMMRFVDEHITSQVRAHTQTNGNTHGLTAADIDTYTKDELTKKGYGKLLIGAKAKDALTLNGKTLEMIRTRVMNGANTSNFVGDPIPPEKLAEGRTSADYILMGSDNEYARWAYLPDLLDALIPEGSPFFYHEFSGEDALKIQTENFVTNQSKLVVEDMLKALYPPKNYTFQTWIIFNVRHRLSSNVNTRGSMNRYMETIGMAHLNPPEPARPNDPDGYWSVINS